MGKSIDKILSARFLMAVITTVADCFLTLRIVEICAAKDKLDVGIPVAMAFFTTWGFIAKDYFGRSDREQPKPSEPAQKTSQASSKPAVPAPKSISDLSNPDSIQALIERAQARQQQASGGNEFSSEFKPEKIPLVRSPTVKPSVGKRPHGASPILRDRRRADS